MARPLPTGSYPPSSPRRSLEAFSKLRLLILSHPFSFPCCAKLWLIKASKIVALANQKSFKPYLEWIQFFSPDCPQASDFLYNWRPWVRGQRSGDLWDAEVGLEYGSYFILPHNLIHWKTGCCENWVGIYTHEFNCPMFWLESKT